MVRALLAEGSDPGALDDENDTGNADGDGNVDENKSSLCLKIGGSICKCEYRLP